MPPKARGPIVCKENVKDEATLKSKPCGKRLEDSRCPDKSQHMMKYPTGFCSNGDCEGAAKKTKDGKPRRTCRDWKICPHKCHQMFDMMFTMSEMPRILVDNSGYAVDHTEFWVPTAEERMAWIASSRPRHADAPVIIKSPAPDTVPMTVAYAFNPTTTGRAARGELESWVKDACDIWLVENQMATPDQHLSRCTPPYLANEISKEQGIKEPSVGAIDAVLKRWSLIGFAVTAAKPARFIEYTPEGIRIGLDGCKDKIRRNKKMANAASARGSLR